ncbi:hypothetical protein CDL15_Pgr017508 [Punica granatum]|uniref:Uncharacterized protein n=1 Tax=Punica granatum TaxID=22663 RepID=A0A218WU90_PUNGR|nr:hypothetical protein CDL15_Pgr017508 [Punica granatum]
MHIRGARRTGRAAGVHGRRQARGARGQARGRAGVRPGARRACKACVGALAGEQLAHGWHCSPESDDSSPEMH